MPITPNHTPSTPIIVSTKCLVKKEDLLMIFSYFTEEFLMQSYLHSYLLSNPKSRDYLILIQTITSNAIASEKEHLGHIVRKTHNHSLLNSSEL